MQISNTNYEAFFLDYWEGNLNDVQVKYLSDFLEKHPGLQNDFLDFKEALAVKLAPDDLSFFQGRDSLKKAEIQSVGNINENNYENWIIAHLEGELSLSQNKTLKRFLLENNHLDREVDLFRHTFLKPELQIFYTNKSALKKKFVPFYRKPVFFALNAAAVVILLFTLFFAPFEHTIDRSEAITDSGIVPTIIEPISPKPFTISKENQNSSGLSNPKSNLIATSDILIVHQPESPSIEPIEAIMEVDVNYEMEFIAVREPLHIDFLQATHPVKMLQSEKVYLTVLPQPKNPENITTDILQLTEADSHDGLLKRIAENIGRRIFGVNDGTIEQTSLLTEVANKGIERINDFRNIGFTQEGEGDQRHSEAVFALSDRLSIRIKRGNRQVENSF